MADVQALVFRRRWEIRRVSDTSGFFHPGSNRLIGAKHIVASAGQYSNPFHVDVVVYWGFDEQGRLVDVWVWKEQDSL
jgi:hypothetical protein